MDKATVEVDPKKRNDLYHQFQKDVVDATPIVYLMELDFLTIYNKKLQGWLVSPLGLYSVVFIAARIRASSSDWIRCAPSSNASLAIARRCSAWSILLAVAVCALLAQAIHPASPFGLGGKPFQAPFGRVPPRHRSARPRPRGGAALRRAHDLADRAGRDRRSQVLVGVTIGGLAGYYGGRVDSGSCA